MGESKRILAVDEQRATLDFLHSVLPLLEGATFDVSRVLSAEEALLELRRVPYDLMIAGLRLPGMDGLELARRAKRLRPAMPIIMATARPLPELRDEAFALGVSHFLQKPLDAEEFLDAVQDSLAAAPPAALTITQDVAQESPVSLPDEAVRRLEALGDDTGAGQVLLATVGGELLHVAGGQLHPDVPRLIAATAASVSCSLYLSDQLDEQEPRVVQFLEGKDTDLYWANVGHDYFVAILFDAQIRRGRIGTVWVFAQRAISDLKKLLAPAPSASETGLSTIEKTTDGAVPAEPPPAAEVARDPAAEAAREVVPEPASEPMVEPAEPADHSPAPVDPKIDAFWDEALASETGDNAFTSGISLQEAKEKGLLAEDFNPDDLREES